MSWSKRREKERAICNSTYGAGTLYWVFKISQNRRNYEHSQVPAKEQKAIWWQTKKGPHHWNQVVVWVILGAAKLLIQTFWCDNELIIPLNLSPKPLSKIVLCPQKTFWRIKTNIINNIFQINRIRNEQTINTNRWSLQFKGLETMLKKAKTSKLPAIRSRYENCKVAFEVNSSSY